MPVNIEQVTSDVTLFEDDVPLSKKQIERIAEAVLELLERQRRENESSREAMMVRASAMPSLDIDR